jgi:hypothetical protein
MIEWCSSDRSFMKCFIEMAAVIFFLNALMAT